MEEVNNIIDSVRFNTVNQWDGNKHNPWRMVDVCGHQSNLEAGERLMLARRDTTVMRKPFPVWKCEASGPELPT